MSEYDRENGGVGGGGGGGGRKTGTRTKKNGVCVRARVCVYICLCG